MSDETKTPAYVLVPVDAAAVQAEPAIEWNEQDALALLAHDSDGSFGQDDVDDMMLLLKHVELIRAQKTKAATQPQATEREAPWQFHGHAFDEAAKTTALDMKLYHDVRTATYERELKGAKLLPVVSQTPLTDEQIDALEIVLLSHLKLRQKRSIVRRIEAAHGIGVSHPPVHGTDQQP